MSLADAIQGATHTGQQITWTRTDDTAQDLTSATLSGTITNVVTGTTVAIAGTLAVVTAASGIFSWTYAAADVAASGQYRVQFTASYGATYDESFIYDWTVLPISTSAAPRSTMLHLITRLRRLLSNDTTLSDIELQELLDDHAVAVNARLEPRAPFYTEHLSPFENLEIGARVFYGYNTLLTLTTDYTIDCLRGIVTTPAADYRGLAILGKAYDINAAAADGWERLASQSADAFAWSDVEGSYHPEQARQYKLDMAKQYRRKAWAMSRTVERADTPVLADSQAWNADVIRRAKAGY